jgi:tetratricopeptide (TPR) repeat protein
VRPLLPGAPGCLVLVTSRNQLTGLAAADGALLFTLNVLTEADVRELMARRLGPERVAGEPVAVAELSRLCARLPLALSVAAAHAAARPRLTLAALAAELRSTGDPLDVLRTGEAATDVRTVFSWSCQQLTEPAARMFRLLGVHPGPDITIPAAASLTGQPLSQARATLAELDGAHLVIERTLGRYACHDLLRAYAAEQAAAIDSDGARHAALHRVFDHYLQTAVAATALIHPFRDPVTLSPPAPGVWHEELTSRLQALEWFQAERQVLLAAIRQAAGQGFHRHAWQLPWAVATFLNWHGYWHELAATQESALTAAGDLGDLAGQAEAHRYLGQAQIRLGALVDATGHLEAALELFRRLGNRTAQARAHYDLAHICELRGRAGDALRHAWQALQLYRAAGHQSGEAIALNAVGWFHTQLGHYWEALDYSTQALAMHGKLGNRTGEADTLDSLGYAHHQLGHCSEAIACYQRAIEALGDADDLHMRAMVLGRLGDAHDAAGHDKAARDAWHKALAMLDGLNHPDAAGMRSRLGRPGA